MKLESFHVRHQKRISRPCTWARITPDDIRAIKPLKDDEESHVNPAEKPSINEKDWTKTLEDVHECFGAMLGATEIPIAHVTRDDREPLPNAVDGAGNCDTPQEEMIARAPHKVEGPAGVAFENGANHPECIADDRAVCTLLKELTIDSPCHTHVKQSVRRHDGLLTDCFT